MIFETKRLILRAPRMSDWKDIVEGAGELDVSRNLAVVPYPYKKKHAVLWIKKCIEKSKKKERDDYTFFIELKSENKVIGATGIHKINREARTAITGSWINKKYWRKGYILEAKLPVLDFAFNKLKLNRIESSAHVENTASNRMSKKIGLKYEGTKRQSALCEATGKIHDENIYSILKSEWKTVKPKLVKIVERKI